jgi:hypothetical protein
MGLRKETWLALLWDNIFKYFENDKFLRLCRDVSHAITEENGSEFINFQYAGAAPTASMFTKNFRSNGTTELPIYDRTDLPDRVKLDRYSSPQMFIPAIDLYAIKYDKKGSVNTDTAMAMIEMIVREAMWNIAPQSNTANCPVITVDATNPINPDDNRKTITKKELKAMRVKLDNIYPSMQNKVWTLIMDVESYWDIVLNDPILTTQYGYLNTPGRVASELPDLLYANFHLVCDGRTPYYTGVSKKAFNQTPTLAAGDSKSAIVVFDQMTIAKAQGRIELFDQSRHPGKQADLSSFAQYAYIGPWGQTPANYRYAGAILRTP